jgi:hypothetical protein
MTVFCFRIKETVLIYWWNSKVVSICTAINIVRWLSPLILITFTTKLDAKIGYPEFMSFPRKEAPDTPCIEGEWALWLILVLWRTEFLLRPWIIEKCTGPPARSIVTVLTELSWLPHYCVLHNVLLLPCQIRQTFIQVQSNERSQVL